MRGVSAFVTKVGTITSVLVRGAIARRVLHKNDFTKKHNDMCYFVKTKTVILCNY